MLFKQFILKYYELCNIAVYSLLLENVNSDSRKILLKRYLQKSIFTTGTSHGTTDSSVKSISGVNLSGNVSVASNAHFLT